MKPKDRLKNIAKTLTTEDGSIFFTSEDYDNMKWLINRVKKLEKALTVYAGMPMHESHDHASFDSCNFANDRGTIAREALEQE